MMTRDEGNLAVLFGDDIHDVAAFLRDTRPVWTTSATGSLQVGSSKSWDMGVGYQGAWRLANDGWTQGALDLSTAVSAIEASKAQAELRYDFGGSQVDVPRFLGGSPDCMIRRGSATRAKPVVHIVVNGSVSAVVSGQAIAAYGAALTAVIDAIENGGRRVELDIVYGLKCLGAGYNGKERAIVGWKVKTASDHVDMSVVAFTVAHPAAFRRIGFGLIERLPARHQNSSYGRCENLLPSDLNIMGMEGALILPAIGESNFGIDPKKAMALAIAQINHLAGEELVSAP